MKRLFALLLALALLLPVMTAFAAPTENEKQSLWEQIAAYENEHLRQTRGKAVTAADYAALSGDIAEIVMASDDYTEGTCTYNGTNAMFFWEDADGEPQGYSPSLRARIARSVTDAPTEDVTETASYATRGGTTSGKNVYVIGPWYGKDKYFTEQYKNEGQSIAKATGGTYTLYSGTDANITNVAKAMQDGAVVIFDSHGLTDYDQMLNYTYPDDRRTYVYDSVTGAHTSYLTLSSGTGLTTADKAAVKAADGETYYHAFSFYSGGSTYYCVDGTAIANHMTQDAPHSILWMPICLGMATDGICTPMRAKGVEVVYGYSQSVTFDGDYLYEDDFWTEMKNGSDVASAISVMKNKNADWDPVYASISYYNTIANARKYYVAFPVVVSSEDTYPGQRTSSSYGADSLQTVNSTWKLLGGAHTTHTLTYNKAQAATCTEAGSIAYWYCAGCGQYFADEAATTVLTASQLVIPATGHQPVTDQARAATCTEPGLTEGSHCAVCNTVLTEQKTIGALGHDMNNWSVSAAATCTADGQQKRICSRCDFVETKTIAKLGHDMTDWTVVLAPTCQAAGQQKRICSRCDFAETKTIAKLGHDMNNWSVSAAATCTADGQQKRICSRCDFVETKTIAKLGHDMTDWTVVLAPTCQAAGRSERSCTRCDLKETKELPMLACPSAQYQDVEKTAWYHDAVDFAVQNGIMNGVSDTAFAPNNKLTRAMLATILYRIDGDSGSHEHPFTDVEKGSWYEKAVAWAYSSGVINGTGATTFAPNENVTREQAAAMLYRYTAYCGEKTDVAGDLSAFRDADSISAYAVEPMRWAVGMQILNGKGDGILDPTGTATRAEITKIIMKWAG